MARSDPRRRRRPRRGLLRHRPVLRFLVRGALSLLIVGIVLAGRDHVREVRQVGIEGFLAGTSAPCGHERRGAAVFHRAGC